jgi:hypothetical protein
MKCFAPWLLLPLFLLCSCTTWTRIPKDEIRESLHVDDEIRLQTTEGQRYQFVVREIGDRSLVGPDERVSLDDIEWLERGTDETLETVGLVALGAVLSVLYVAATLGLVFAQAA